MSISLECANCGSTDDLPENPSLARVNKMAEDFLVQHQKPHPLLEPQHCKLEHIFIRTFSV